MLSVDLGHLIPVSPCIMCLSTTGPPGVLMHPLAGGEGDRLPELEVGPWGLSYAACFRCFIRPFLGALHRVVEHAR